MLFYSFVDEYDPTIGKCSILFVLLPIDTWTVCDALWRIDCTVLNSIYNFLLIVKLKFSIL